MAAILFDMDGVLVNSERYWLAYHREFVFDAAVDDPSVDPERYAGLGVTDTYRRLDEAGVACVDKDRFVELNHEAAMQIYGDEVALLDGFDDWVARLQADGLGIGLVSSSYRRWIDIVLERFGITDRFDAVVSGEHLDRPGKPEPHVYEYAADVLSVPPKECLVVEDSATGVAAARAAGMACLGYLEHANRETLDGATVCVSGTEELREHVGRWIEIGTVEPVDGFQ